MVLSLKPLTQHLVVSVAIPIGLILTTTNPAAAFIYSLDSTSQSSNNSATGASASVEFKFSDLSNDQIQVDLTVTNTTGQLEGGLFGDQATSSSLTGIAFDVFDGLSLVSRNTHGNLDTWLDDVDFNPFSNSVGDFTVALADNNNFEGGNPNGAVATGETSTASFVVTGFTPDTTSSELRERFRQAFESKELDIAARFQQVNAGAGSEKLLGGVVIGEASPEKSTQIPEPGNVSGLGVAIGLVAFSRRKLNQTKNQYSI